MSDTDINKEVDWEGEWRKRNYIIAPSRPEDLDMDYAECARMQDEGVYTITVRTDEINMLFEQMRHTIAEKAREEERERIEEKIKGMTVNGNAMVGLANDLLQAFKSEALSTPQSNEK